MTPWMRKIHKWIGLLIGLQLVNSNQIPLSASQNPPTAALTTSGLLKSWRPL